MITGGNMVIDILTLLTLALTSGWMLGNLQLWLGDRQ
jgi:hypothetical protein